MKYLFLVAIILLGFGSYPAMSADEPPVYETSDQLTASLINVSQTAVTRENQVSLFLTQLKLAPLEIPKTGETMRYALVIDVNLIPDDGDQKQETFSFISEQPVEISSGSSSLASLASGFRTIFSNVSLSLYREAQLKIYLIRLDAAEKERFSQVAGLFGNVIQRSMLKPLLGVLGIFGDVDSQDLKVLSFEGRFLIPGNYWAHQNATRAGFPVLNNDANIAIAFQRDVPISNTNVVSYLKNVINKFSLIVAGKTVLNNYDKVQGFAVFTVTKSQVSPIPKALKDTMLSLKISAEKTVLNEEYSNAILNSDFLANKLAPEMSPSSYANVATFIELVKLYTDFRRVNESDSADQQQSKKIASTYQSWLNQSRIRLQQQPEFGPRVKGIYQVDNEYPVIIYPFGLGDQLILASVLWQVEMHKFVAELAKSEKTVRVKKFTFRL